MQMVLQESVKLSDYYLLDILNVPFGGFFEKNFFLNSTNFFFDCSFGNMAEGATMQGPIVGTCMDMCPLKERLDRQEFHDLSVFEKLPYSNELINHLNDFKLNFYCRVDHKRAVKKYARPSVNLERQDVSPDEIRPPAVLKRTQEYLFNEILERADQPFYEIHNFLRDRLRSIR
jgi:hypothetical protein